MARIFYYVAIAQKNVHMFGPHWDEYVQGLYRKSENYLLIGTSRERLSDNNIQIGLSGITIDIETPDYDYHHARAIAHVEPQMIAALKKRRDIKIEITEAEDLETMITALRKNQAAEERQHRSAETTYDMDIDVMPESAVA